MAKTNNIIHLTTGMVRGGEDDQDEAREELRYSEGKPDAVSAEQTGKQKEAGHEQHETAKQGEDRGGVKTLFVIN